MQACNRAPRQEMRSGRSLRSLCSLRSESPPIISRDDTRVPVGGDMETAEREIRFQAEDGWTIYGSLNLPAGASTERSAPAALLLHGAGHDRDAFTSFVYPGMSEILTSKGVAVLRIDWRGRGQSIGEQEYHSFSDNQRAKICLDVKAALDFIAAQPGIDRDRIAIFAEEVSAEWAVTGSEGDPRVKALALLSG